MVIGPAATKVNMQNPGLQKKGYDKNNMYHHNRARKAARDAKAVRGEMHNVLALMRRFDRSFQIPTESSAILKSFKILHDHMQNVTSLDSISAAQYLKPFLDAIADCIANEDGGCLAHSGGTEYYTAMEIAVHALASVNKFVLYDIIHPGSRGVPEAMQKISDTISCCALCPSEADEVDKKEKKLIILFKLLELIVCCLRSAVRIDLSFFMHVNMRTKARLDIVLAEII